MLRDIASPVGIRRQEEEEREAAKTIVTTQRGNSDISSAHGMA